MGEEVVVVEVVGSGSGLPNVSAAMLAEDLVSPVVWDVLPKRELKKEAIGALGDATQTWEGVRVVTRLKHPL